MLLYSDGGYFVLPADFEDLGGLEAALSDDPVSASVIGGSCISVCTFTDGGDVDIQFDVSTERAWMAPKAWEFNFESELSVSGDMVFVNLELARDTREVVRLEPGRYWFQMWARSRVFTERMLAGNYTDPLEDHYLNFCRLGSE